MNALLSRLAIAALCALALAVPGAPARATDWIISYEGVPSERVFARTAGFSYEAFDELGRHPALVSMVGAIMKEAGIARHRMLSTVPGGWKGQVSPAVRLSVPRAPQAAVDKAARALSEAFLQDGVVYYDAATGSGNKAWVTAFPDRPPNGVDAGELAHIRGYFGCMTAAYEVLTKTRDIGFATIPAASRIQLFFLYFSPEQGNAIEAAAAGCRAVMPSAGALADSGLSSALVEYEGFDGMIGDVLARHPSPTPAQFAALLTARQRAYFELVAGRQQALGVAFQLK